MGPLFHNCKIFFLFYIFSLGYSLHPAVLNFFDGGDFSTKALRNANAAAREYDQVASSLATQMSSVLDELEGTAPPAAATPGCAPAAPAPHSAPTGITTPANTVMPAAVPGTSTSMPMVASQISGAALSDVGLLQASGNMAAGTSSFNLSSLVAPSYLHHAALGAPDTVAENATFWDL